MKQNILKSVIAKNSDTIGGYCEALGLSRNAVNRRMNGDTEFSAAEIKATRNRYQLTPEEIADIFFSD